LFEFIEEPKTYSEILENFEYKDIPYTSDLFDVLKNDKDNIIIYSDENGTFQKNLEASLPKIDDLLTIRNFERIFEASKVPQKFAKAVTNRLKGISKEFIEELGTPGPSLFEYDEALTHRLYTALRNTVFAFINHKELSNKRMLDIGCGSGRETAELWMKFKGNIDLTGVDPVEGFINTAQSQFPMILSETIQKLAPNKVFPELTEDNHPKFFAMKAEQLEFPNESFDVIFLQQILHWTSDPEKAISEIGRILKPGGIFFGCQGTLPLHTPYMNILIRAHENVHGWFSLDDYKKWLGNAGFIDFKRVTPAGVFRTVKKS
jgi:ubiquinone/menaquinone biosynthesis C-methylase UbiE